MLDEVIEFAVDYINAAGDFSQQKTRTRRRQAELLVLYLVLVDDLDRRALKGRELASS